MRRVGCNRIPSIEWIDGGGFLDCISYYFRRGTALLCPRTQQRCVPTPTFPQTRTSTPPAADETLVPSPPPPRTQPAVPQTAAARPLPRSGAVLPAAADLLPNSIGFQPQDGEFQHL